MRWTAAVTGVLCLLTAGAAQAEVIHFMHPHPMPPGVTRGMCHIEGPHIHAFAPHKKLLYYEVDDHWVFIGDPVEYEPKGPKYAYYGHHPVFWAGEDPRHIDHYCYITGPHHHYYAPPPSMKFKVKGGVYWWVGNHPKWYRKRYKRYRPVDHYYARVDVVRPVVTVAPPSGYVGFVVGPRGRARVHGVVHGGIHVVPPPPPGISLSIGVPSVGVAFGAAPAPGHVHVHHYGPGHRHKHWKRRHGHKHWRRGPRHRVHRFRRVRRHHRARGHFAVGHKRKRRRRH